MSYQCDVCGKSYMRGNLVSHSKQRMHRIYKPNLHPVKTVINGVAKRVRACTKCLRKIKNKKVEQGIKAEQVEKVVKAAQVTKVEQVGKVVKVVKGEQAEKGPMVKKTTVAELLKEKSKTSNRNSK
ncbi:MAG: 50S ribosomal protein L28 [Patescibacteria group bacterium]|nr:50S ribosomal protein L28 [Patescibacteria group bacterium]